MSSLAYISGPSVEPLGLDEARRHIRVDSTEDDDLILGLIPVARQYCEAKCNRSFGVQTWKETFDAFPNGRYIELRNPPLVSVTSITYLDDNGIPTVFGSSNYIVASSHVPGRIILENDSDWPSTQTQQDAVSVLFTAGAVPVAVKHAMKLVVGELFQNREMKIIGSYVVNNDMIDNLLSPHQIVYMR